MDGRAPRQLHSLPSMRGGGGGLGFGSRPRRGRRLAMGLALVAMGGIGMRATAQAPADQATDSGASLRAMNAGDVMAAPAPDPASSGGASRWSSGEASRWSSGGASRWSSGEASRWSSGGASRWSTPESEPPAVAVQPFAAVGDLVVHLPSTDVLLVGYHEASLPGVMEMRPIGVGASNDNTTRITLPPDDAAGPDYHVMSSRGRVHPPTSAVDIVMRDDDPVLAPVDGVVTEVRPYALYGRHADTRIEIQPTDAPDLRVVMIHVADVRVDVGDRVTTGTTEVAGTANRFSFASHVDRYLDERWPHVHLEVKGPRMAARGS